MWDVFLESNLSTYGIGGNRFKNPNMWALLNKVDETLGVARGKNVFDVGCGTGIKSILIAIKGAKVRGFDVDPKAIENCRKNLNKNKTPVDVDFQLTDAQNKLSGEYDGRVDFIFCNQVIEHIQDYQKTIDAMARALKPGGKILITTPNKFTHKPKGSQKVFGEELGHRHAFSRDDLQVNLGGRNDLEIEELTTHHPMPRSTTRFFNKIVSKLNEFQWFLQIFDERHGTPLEKLYVVMTMPLVAIHNSLVYPRILKSYMKDERKITGDEGLTIYLVLKKR